MKIKPVKLGAIEPEQAVFIGTKPVNAFAILKNTPDLLVNFRELGLANKYLLTWLLELI